MTSDQAQSLLSEIGDGGVAVDHTGIILKVWGVLADKVSVRAPFPAALPVLQHALRFPPAPRQSQFLTHLDSPLHAYMAWIGGGQTFRVAVLMRNRPLLELTREHDAIIDSSSDGLFVCDGQGRILRVNPASARINQAQASQLEGRPYEEAAAEGLVILPSAALEAIKSQQTVSLLQENRHGRKLISTATPVFDDQRQLIRVVVSERDITEIERLKKELEEQQALGHQFRRQLSEIQQQHMGERPIIAESPAMKATLRQARRLSEVDSTVLLLGESGVGKGLIADLIHSRSRRAPQPMIKLNCGAIPEALFEAELFGYEKGAFTGAVGNKPGQFELADKGTIFLDEIAEMPAGAQVKLLRFMEDGRLTRLGGTRERRVDVRIIAATNRNLQEQVAAGAFRADLYYRLSVIPLHIPPLRRRRECLIPLINNFIAYFCRRDGVDRQLTTAALNVLCDYDFPGNVRELMNLCERLVVLSDADQIDVRQLASVLSHRQRDGAAQEDWPYAMTMHEILTSTEREVLLSAYRRFGRQALIARHLGMSQPTVARKLQRYGIGTFPEQQTGHHDERDQLAGF